MGLVKSMFYEDQQRGWSEIDDMYVCADCIYESFLQTIILDNLCSTTCCYCSASDVSPIAAPVRILQESLYGAVHTYFAEPTGAGVPYDGGFIIEPKYIDEVLGDLGFDCDIGLWDDLVNADAGNGYVNACNGHWATSHENERLSDSWSYFEDTVKHRTRFNFASLDGDEYMGSQDIPPRYMLETLGDLLQPVVTTLAVHTSVYRVRSRTVRKTWKPDAQQMGAPNPEIATAGRMNPAGIPYLYTAFDFNTAVHEARAETRTTSTVFVGRFETTQPLVLVDFTASFDMPSLFDLNRQRERENILFFYRFVEQISQPVRPDDRVHLSYIPTQVVCEYLAQVFQTNEGKQLDGIIFPSSLFKGGKNLVVFPSKERGRLEFRGVNFKEVFRYQRPRRQHPTGPFDQPAGKLLPME